MSNQTIWPLNARRLLVACRGVRWLQVMAWRKITSYRGKRVPSCVSRVGGLDDTASPKVISGGGGMSCVGISPHSYRSLISMFFSFFRRMSGIFSYRRGVGIDFRRLYGHYVGVMDGDVEIPEGLK